ncbi:MAG TPA: IPT/TIG domain-containing protein [Gemmatimonadaceae bacterium]|nr:IPT/TIG domain-containing protein [Gemmatimonadaceae bacterium]
MRQGVSTRIVSPLYSFAFIGVALGATACGGGGGDDPPTGPSTTVGSISITPADPAAIPAGGTLQLTGTVLSTTGQPMSGQTISYSSTATGIVTVSSEGLVTSVGPIGAATIIGAVGTVTRGVTVNVVAGAAASLTRTSADPGAVSPGSTTGDSVRFVVRDAFANPRAGETITFTIAEGGGLASPAAAATDALGRAATRFITGATAGTNTLNATVVGLSPSSLTVTTVAGTVVISSISPSPMTPGATVTITGTGFNPTAPSNSVSVNDQPVFVTSATSTQIIFTLPAIWPCTPTHQANVQVAANGASATAQQTLRPGALRTLPVGGTLVLTSAADLRCTELSPASAQYAVNVLNTSTAPTAVSPFRIAGTSSIPPGTTLSTRPFTLRQSARAPRFRSRVAAQDALPRRSTSMHGRILDANRAILERMRTRFRRAPQKLATATGSRASLAVPAVGDTRVFRVIAPSSALGGSLSCAEFVEITARAVYVGSKGVIYEDAAAPLAGQMDSYFTQIGQEFDTKMFATVNTYFGDPLVTDAGTDNDQRLNMVFTPAIPAGIAGFVISCDFFERNTTNNQSSNFGEYFYARVPTVAGPGFTGNTADSWLRTMRGTIVHEVKHIASFGAHLVNLTSFEQSWLEEGMAMLSEEMWAREWVYAGATWKGNMNYMSTLFCDVRPTLAECSGAPFVMFDHYATLYDYLDEPGATSVFGRVADGDFVFYAASWSLIRYNLDRYAGSEATYLRGITNGSGASLTGMANIAAQSGADANEILGMWSLALYLDENAAMAGNADVRFPSWNTVDIYESMNRDFFATQGLFPKVHPLVPQVVPGDFSIEHAGIHGGSFSPYSLATAGGNSRTIALSAPGSGPPPSTLRLVIARTQ